AALLYPALGLLEMTNISVGRGTDRSFEWLGAPWIEGAPLAEALGASLLPGVRFDPLDFTPNDSVYSGQECHGVRVTVTDRAMFDPVRTGLSIARHLRHIHGERFDHEKVQKMLANDAAHRAWQSATPDQLSS